MDASKILTVMAFLTLPVSSLAVPADKQQQIILAQSSSILCGIKPLPRIGYEIGRCVNGQWEQVSRNSSGTIECGIKPLPRIGYEIGRCVNGRWEQVSK